MPVATDRESDNVDCGVGTDSFEVDPTDNVASCENGSAGVLRLAPRALAAEAATTARLRLSSHHPQNWRKLRKIELRLLSRDGVPVGEVAIRRARRADERRRRGQAAA